MFEKSLLVLVSVTGGIYDLKSRRVPNWLTLGTFLLMLVINILQIKVDGIMNSISGFVVGIMLLIIPYALGGMGAGDVKLLGAIGSIIGVKGVIYIFVYTAFSGFFLCLFWILRRSGHLKFLITTGQIFPVVEKKEKVPYGIAIMLGTLIYVIFGSNNFIKLPI